MRKSLSPALIFLAPLALAACGDGDARAEGARDDNEWAEDKTPDRDASGEESAEGQDDYRSRPDEMGGTEAGVDGTQPAPPGSPQRTAILDTVRPSVNERLGSDVEFVVNRLDVSDGWALVSATPQHRGGGEIDGIATFTPEELDQMDGLEVTALARFGNGGWTLVDHRIGATDVWYVEYCDQTPLAC